MQIEHLLDGVYSLFSEMQKQSNCWLGQIQDHFKCVQKF